MPEHAQCVVGTYSEWVIDGDYDWPPKCPICDQNLLAGQEPTIRLSCLHVTHTSCLAKHIQQFPPYTAPAGYVCPSCPMPLWPSEKGRDSSTSLYTKLRLFLSKTPACAEPTMLPGAKPGGSTHGAPGTINGNGGVAVPADAKAGKGSAGGQSSPRGAAKGSLTNGPATGGGGAGSQSSPPAGAGWAAERGSAGGDGGGGGAEAAGRDKFAAARGSQEGHAAAVDAEERSNAGPATSGMAVAMSARKLQGRAGSQALDTRIDVDTDEEGGDKKYARRGNWYEQFVRRVLPVWVAPQPTLPVSAVDELIGDGPSTRGRASGRKRKKLLHADPKHVLLVLALLSCFATMLLLYSRMQPPPT
eukprot:jgi/Mesvir1/17739/Mv05595-RA.1